MEEELKVKDLMERLMGSTDIYVKKLNTSTDVGYLRKKVNQLDHLEDILCLVDWDLYESYQFAILSNQSRVGIEIDEYHQGISFFVPTGYEQAVESMAQYSSITALMVSLGEIVNDIKNITKLRLAQLETPLTEIEINLIGKIDIVRED